MATWYANSAASGTGAGTSWANACTTIAAAVAKMAAGDDLDVATTHSESISGFVNWTFPGTSAAPNRVFSCDTINAPALGSDVLAGAKTTVTTTNGLTIAGYVYLFGITFSLGSGTGAVSQLNVNAVGEYIFDTCAISIVGTNAGEIEFGESNKDIDVKLINTTISFSSTGQSILVQGCRFTWKDTASALGTGSAPTTLFKGGNSGTNPTGPPVLMLDGVDLSLLGSSDTVMASDLGGPTVAQLRNCKLGSGVTVAATPTTPAGVITDLINSDSSATGYRQERYRYQGTLTTETTIVKAGGASDDVTPISWKVVSTANAKRQSPFETFEIVQWVDTAGSSHTATIDVITDTHTDATLTNADVWMEAQVMDNAGAPVTSRYTSTPANLLTAGTTLATSSASWTTTGMTTPNAQKMSVTFTNQIKGYVRFVVKVGRASLATLRIDPNVSIV